MTAAATTGRRRWLKRVWARLPQDRRWLSEGELDELLIEATNSYPGDFAYASAIRASLVVARAVEVRQVENGRDLEYKRGEWHDWSDPGIGSEQFNEQLRRDHEQLEAELRRQDEQRAREFANSPLGVERQQVLDLIDQKVDARLRPLEETVSRLCDQLNGTAQAAPVTDEGREAGRRESDN